MNKEFKKILITGGCSGIGRALVDYFLKNNYKIGVFDFNKELCNSLAEDTNGEVKTWFTDISDPESVKESCLNAFADSFYPDILINNAGIIHSEPLVNVLKKSKRVHSINNWRKVISTNLDSVFYVTSNIVDNMIQLRRKGVIISISSICANGNAGQSAYSASKAGVNSLTKTWSKELGPLGIRFAAIAPGFIDTESTRNSLSFEQILHLKKSIPIRRLGMTKSITQAAEFIITNEYVNGSIISVDGGLVL